MRLTGDAAQSSDQKGTAMSMRDVAAHNAEQKQAVDSTTLEVLGWRGRGKWAVVALLVVALAAFAAKTVLR